jgi:chloramphenicol-sensitive protein RarD
MQISPAHISAITAFSLWGLFPLYWNLFEELSAWDLFGHRLVWSFVTLLILLFLKKKMITLKEIWQDPKLRTQLFFSSLLISSNWLLYIYAVQEGKVLEASMGYFLNPLINVLMGWIFLKEVIRKYQWPSIFLGLAAVIYLGITSDLSQFPWMALTLSLTFALYGLVRKMTKVGSLEGLAFETSLMIFPVLIFWPFLNSSPLTSMIKLGALKGSMLTLSGLITCIPLILFAFSTKRLKLQTLGFIQYLSPTLKFICGWLILGENLKPEKLVAFAMIWIGLMIYSSESFIFHQKQIKKINP